tara:strand:+ start:122 stop:433 length:312 start_codon:yes stop_codon:yes gene_type:complete
MKKIRIFVFLYLILIILSSCGTIKKGFQNPKKNSSDEFLVEKKSPLVMPPEFNELPFPNSQNDNTKKEVNNIKELIGENKQDKNNVISNNDIEGSILDKIKTN